MFSKSYWKRIMAHILSISFNFYIGSNVMGMKCIYLYHCCSKILADILDNFKLMYISCISQYILNIFLFYRCNKIMRKSRKWKCSDILHSIVDILDNPHSTSMSLEYTTCTFLNFHIKYTLINIYHKSAFMSLKNILHNILCRCTFNNHSHHTINHHMKIQRRKCSTFNQVWSLIYTPCRWFDFSIVSIICYNSFDLKCILYNCLGHFSIQDIQACTLIFRFLKEHKVHFLNYAHGRNHNISTVQTKQLKKISLFSLFNEKRQS